MDVARTESHDEAGRFGALLRQLRSRAGMTQEALAERAKLGVRTVRGLETGERADPRVGTVRQIADALELEAADRVSLFAAAGHARADGHATGERAVREPEPDRPRSVVDDRLAEAAGRLAYSVRTRWQREEEHRQIHDPLPLPVRWRPVAAELTDSWANIRRVDAGDTAAPLDLAGRLDGIVDVYRRIPSGRLVVLGRAGSGKTVLALRFVLDMLKNRAADAPVPVIFGLGSWNPTTTALRDWLTEQLVRDHPDLAAPGPGSSTLAAALVETGHVLPVLDGFDEIATGLHRAALDALNGTGLPLLLTSRPDEYADAVAGIDVLTAAAGVELTDLTTADLADYLPRTTRKTGRDGPVWQPVLTELGDRPDSPASVNLAAVLTTPLMVVLARTIYSDSPEHDPAELLDTDRFPSREALEDHLLGTFVPTVYRRRPSEQEWDLERVQRWLGYLADHLTRLGTHDLAWWQLGTAMRRPSHLLVVGLAVGLVMGLVNQAVDVLLARSVTTFSLVFSVMIGLMSGTAFALAHLLVTRRGETAIRPSRVRFRIRGAVRAGVGPRLRIGFVSGLLLGVQYGLVREVARGLMLGVGQGPLVGIVDAVVFGIVFGFGAALVIGVMGLFEAPLNIRAAADPTSLLRANRTTVLVQVLVFGSALALVVPLTGWLTVLGLQQALLAVSVSASEFTFYWDPVFGLAIGLVGGVGGGLAYALSLTAWGHWVVFARVWLPLTGRLPWALPAFLDDAYRRGVLRRAGAVYQFRHARLEDHLSRSSADR
ncbi:NACHT domain-containing protein [Saccharothrix deserti]|uniref:NACHT domain-containing protein n=1 Tax=Saccharothrix deserti TaxID=2593674 RepID=UPI002368B918|nr:XRE family transcriptional regulator [Saccharothrix deserti]